MNRPLIKVLVVDDDEDDFFITKEIFEEIPVKNISIEWAPNFEKGLQSYVKGLHDIYFVDYLLGAQTGLDFLLATRQVHVKNPVIMITGNGDQQVDKMAMAYGASDYLVKSELDAENLERAMRYALGRFVSSKQLADSEAKYRNVFEKSKDMIFIADAKGTFVDCNSSSVNILGYEREELLGRKIYDLFEDDAEKEVFKNLISNKSDVLDYERVLISKNGQKKVCLISTSVQQDSADTTVIQGVIHDMTKRRKTENDLATAEKLAVTGRIVRMIGHEIRNPLTNINLSLEQVESELKGQTDLGMYFDIIRRNSERINTLITELLNSSKPAQLNVGKVSINKVVKDALDLVRDRIVLKKVKLTTKYSDDICDISIDVEKIKVALLNILVNAVEAVEDDKGELEVSTRGDGDFCIIEIEDNGCGIPADKIDHIFDPFFSGKPKGTGLGLSTTHNIIRSHHGSIDVNSVPGKGTGFIIKFNFN